VQSVGAQLQHLISKITLCLLNQEIFDIVLHCVIQKFTSFHEISSLGCGDDEGSAAI
jgi:hypothetical protein